MFSPAKPRSCGRLFNGLYRVLVVRAETCRVKRSDDAAALTCSSLNHARTHLIIIINRRTIYASIIVRSSLHSSFSRRFVYLPLLLPACTYFGVVKDTSVAETRAHQRAPGLRRSRVGRWRVSSLHISLRPFGTRNSPDRSTYTHLAVVWSLAASIVPTVHLVNSQRRPVSVYAWREILLTRGGVG